MASYWIGDSAGRVLGPLTLQALRDLVGSGKLKAATRASRDGNAWVPIHDFDEVKDLLVASPGNAFELQQADRLRAQLKQLATLPPHEVFGVKASASLDELRNAFFRMAKRYSPERLTPDVLPELRKASGEMFEFLSRKMREADAKVAVRPPPPPPPPPKAPTYGSHEFVGLQRRSDDRIHLDIKLSSRNVGIFTDHPLVNIQSGALFIATDQPLRLGTEVDLTLHFDSPAKRLDTRGSVVWEHAFADGKQQPGYGVRLAGLNATERAFVSEWVRNVRAK